MRKKLYLLLTTALIGFPLRATAIEWSDTGNGNWADSANWSGGVVPTASDVAGVNGSGPAQLTGSAQGFAASLNLGTETSISYGEVIVDGVGTTLTVTNSMEIGGFGTGTLSITNGGSVSAGGFGYLGSSSTGTGTATVDGAGSNLDVNSGLYVGFTGQGTLNISNGGTVSVDGGNGTTYLDFASTGILNIGAAAGSAAEGSGTLNASALVLGTGTLTFNHTNTGYSFAPDITGTGTINFYSGTTSLTGSTSGFTGSIFAEGGTLAITAGQSVHAATGNVGYGAGTNGTVSMSGTGAQWITDGAVKVGGDGTGTLDISTGGAVSNTNGYIGLNAGSTGTVRVDGKDARWMNSGTLFVGRIGAATLDISNGGAVSNVTGYIGLNIGSNATATVDGKDSRWTNESTLSVGHGGIGALDISAGGAVSNTYGNIGFASGSTGTASVAGAGSSWTNLNTLYVGHSGTGTLTASEGGAVSANSAIIAASSGSNGTLNIGAAAGGSVKAPGTLNAGTLAFGAGNGALVFNHTDTGYSFAPDITGNGAIKLYSGTTSLTGDTTGFTGTVYAEGGTLAISAGQSLHDAYGHIGYGSGSNGTATVDGTGASWTNTYNLYVGNYGTGTLTIANGGTVSVDSGNGAVDLGNFTGSSGTLNIGAADGAVAAGAGTLDAASLRFNGITGTLNFNHTDTGYNFSADITGNGTLTHRAGVTRLTGNSSGYIGTTLISGGTLSVNGSLGGGISVNGGTLGGSGTLLGSVSVLNGVVAAGNSPGHLTIGGDLTLASISALDFDLGDPAGVAGVDSDLISVGGNLMLDGTLNVTDAGGMGAGLYRLIDYSGTLTDNGLALGSIPAGYEATAFDIQTAVAGQVNLNVGAATLFAYWDGAGAAGDSAITGGAGTWSTGATNWTLPDGSTNGLFNPATFVVFAGTPGAVAIDNSGGAVSTEAGMQFASDGYTINGGDLAVAGAATFRVGDGTSAGAGYSATIASNLTGSGSLNKTDLGTLNLTGTSAGFTGAATVSGGLLNVDGSLGGVLNVMGGRLGGNGTLNMLNIDSGTLAPGHSVGTLTATNISLASGSTYAVELNDGGFVAGSNNDLINATGTITIDHGVNITVAPENGTDDGSSYSEGTYTIASAAGGVTGTFDSLSDSFLFLDFGLSYDASHVFLTSTRLADFASAASTANQSAVAGAADGLATGNSLRGALLTVSTGAQAQAGYDALSGEGHATLGSGFVQTSRYPREAMLGQAGNNGFNRWASAYGGMATLGSDGNAATVQLNSGGLMTGMGQHFTTGFGEASLGGAIQAGFTRLSLADRATAITSSDLGAGIYGGTALAGVDFSFGAAYTLHQINSTRNVTIGGFSDALTASYTGGTAQLFGEIRHSFDLGATSITPFAGAAWIYDWTQGFTETGGAAALSVAAKSTTALVTTLGATVEQELNLGDQTATLSGTLGWRHTFGATPSISANLPGGGSFSVNGAPIAHDAAILGAGLSFDLAPGAALDLSYSGEIGSRGSDHELAAQLAIRF